MEQQIMDILTEVRIDVDFENEKALIDDRVIESFDVIQIVTALMDEFDIEIDADDIEPENFNSFESICKLVQNKLADK